MKTLRWGRKYRPNSSLGYLTLLEFKRDVDRQGLLISR